MHAEVNLSNFDEQRQQRSHHGDVVAGSGRRSQEGGEGFWAVGASKVGSHTHTHPHKHAHTHTPLLCQRLGDTMSPTAIVGPAWVAPGLLCVSQCVCVSHQRGPCLGRHMPPTQPGIAEGRGRPLATEATSWPILSVTRRPGAMFKVPRLFICDGGRWLGGEVRSFVKRITRMLTHIYTHP